MQLLIAQQLNDNLYPVTTHPAGVSQPRVREGHRLNQPLLPTVSPSASLIQPGGPEGPVPLDNMGKKTEKCGGLGDHKDEKHRLRWSDGQEPRITTLPCSQTTKDRLHAYYNQMGAELRTLNTRAPASCAQRSASALAPGTWVSSPELHLVGSQGPSSNPPYP